ncbi:MAG: hypothetical protein ACI4P0_01495 [Mailhella sp.]
MEQKILTPEVVETEEESELRLRLKAHHVEDMTRLYHRHRPLVVEVENGMHTQHRDYMIIAGPIVSDLSVRLRGNRCIITDFFIDDLHDRSRRIHEQARELRKLFDRQHIAAVNLMRFK